jgi:hypothetical protein
VNQWFEDYRFRKYYIGAIMFRIFFPFQHQQGKVSKYAFPSCCDVCFLQNGEEKIDLLVLFDVVNSPRHTLATLLF